MARAGGILGHRALCAWMSHAVRTGFAVSMLVAAYPGDAHAADPAPVYQKTISATLNSTGRTITMPLPLRDDGRDLGDAVVRIAPDDTVAVPKAALAKLLTGSIDKQALARLEALATQDGYVSLKQLEGAGIAITFDPTQLALKLVPKAEQRPVGEISLAGRSGPRGSAAAAQPAIVSGYLNVIAGVDHRWAGTYNTEATSGRLEFESVFRLWNIVAENDFHYDGLVDTFTCPVGAVCSYGHEQGLKRRRSRLVYDMPESELRLQVGDADVAGTGFQRTADVLGFTLEKSPRKLAPGSSIRPSGRSTLRIERPSDVEVLVNGAVVQKLRLRAGTYNLSDLPLGTGANDVELRVTDDTGAQTTRAFTTFFDASLLGKGKSEWSASAGLPSYYRDDERAYRANDFIATAFYRQGLSDQMTGEAHIQGDKQIVMGGTGVFAMLPWGLVGLQGALSQSGSGLGGAVNVSYDRSNALGLFSNLTGLRESLHLGAEYRTSEFRTPGEYVVTASGVLYPQQNYALRLSASHTVPLPNSVSATLSGRYQFADPNALSLTPYTFKGDRYGVDLTVSSPLSPITTGSISVGYSNESTFAAGTTNNETGDLRVMARLYVRPSQTSSISASFDSLNRDAQVSGNQYVGEGLDRWQTAVDVHYNDKEGLGTGAANASYWGNRFEARVSHDGSFEGGSAPALKGTVGDNQRTSMTVGTGIAFADGAFAIGAPIRGHGFAIVEPHDTLAGKTVTVGPEGYVQARADKLGPGVVTDLPAYSARTLPVDVEDLPLGYSLGQGAFETVSPYRGGYRIVVGSSYSVTAFGTLLKQNGEPLALISGTASQPGKPDKQVAIFTNSNGRFGADGLAPGRWIIDMATADAPTRYAVEVPAGADGLFRAGTLKPIEGGQ